MFNQHRIYLVFYRAKLTRQKKILLHGIEPVRQSQPVFIICVFFSPANFMKCELNACEMWAFSWCWRLVRILIRKYEGLFWHKIVFRVHENELCAPLTAVLLHSIFNVRAASSKPWEQRLNSVPMHLKLLRHMRNFRNQYSGTHSHATAPVCTAHIFMCSFRQTIRENEKETSSHCMGNGI